MFSILVVIFTLFLILLPGGPAFAHSGEPLAPHDAWSAWNWNPFILAGIILAGCLYGLGLRSLWRSASPGRGVSRWQAVAFYTGLLAVFIAEISPLDAMGGVLFSAHMVQHQIFVMVAAPLLVIGLTPAARAWLVPKGWRVGLGRWWHRQSGIKSMWRLITTPWLVWILHAAAVAVWHIPYFYQLAVVNGFVHALEHISFLFTALLFWWVVIGIAEHGRLEYGLGMLYVFTMAMFQGVIGALITFSRQPWYPIYAESVEAWGLTLLADQQLAGAIMWVPGNFVYLLAFVWLMSEWFKAMEHKERHGGARRFGG
jgi:putative membrane protein